MSFSLKRKHQERGKRLIESSAIKNIIFSEGTYQVEVYDRELEETFWPFLQMDDQGQLTDFFCTCEVAEKEKSCSHLGAAYFQLDQGEPLHIRFQRSFWNHLCFMGFIRHGNDLEEIKEREEGKEFAFLSSKGETLFSVRIKTEKGKKILDEYLLKRPKETEETSLKFSNLLAEELALWKRGTPTQKLQYELSFWSDLAKWMMVAKTLHANYSIDFEEREDALPKRVKIFFPDLIFEFYIAEINWENIIPSLQDVASPLRVYEFQNVQIQKITFDPACLEMRIHSHPIREEKIKKKKRIRVGEWEFQSGEGFFLVNMHPLLRKQVISENQIGEFLTYNFKIVERYLVGTKIFQSKIRPSYQLSFDREKNLHISSFAFQVGDLNGASATFFKPWVYFKERGFYPIEPLLFDDVETVISSEEMGEFIDEHRRWLNQHEGFHIHLSNIEFRLTYSFEDLQVLRFKKEAQLFEGSDDLIDFGDWFYIAGKGFYKKLRLRTFTKITPETEVHRSKIPHFIHTNQEELEQVKGFFNPNEPIEKGGLIIELDEQKRIHVQPEFTYLNESIEKKIHFVGSFTYVEGLGFSKIPKSLQLLTKYLKKGPIEKSQEVHFVSVELPKLNPYIIKMDHRLKKPKHLNLKLKCFEQADTELVKKWTVEFVYETEFGEELVGTIKEKLDHFESYAMTNAGLIFFKDPRFNWLRELSPDQIGPNGRSVKLSTLEWIRLRVYEEIQLPSGEMEKEKKSIEQLMQMDAFETSAVLHLDLLKSTLRPYQKVGVKWLWFLYSFGLSGLLCDDMGLGKTHQAMALLAASRYEKERGKYIVVCPTSVIYHWEELLSRFLPTFKVTVFYGTQRTLKAFDVNTDLLLTSYGTFRSERKAISKIFFHLAIFDEIQVAKNIHSQTHQSLSMIKAGTKIGLTGTPIENHLLELKALFDLILPGYFPSLSQYREHFIAPIEKHQDKEKKKFLSQLIHPFVLRRKKSEVLKDLPEKMEEIAWCFLSEEQQKLYKEAYICSRDSLFKEVNESKTGASYLHVFALLNYLKQICNHPSLILKDIDNYQNHQSGKWDLFVELVNETLAGGQKLVIFTQYLNMMKIFENYFKKLNIGFSAIRGSTRDRKKQIERFRDDPSCAVFIASLKAAGTGIDLTAGSVVIHYDRWWNPAKENQATDRVHRIGQNRGVQVFKMVTKSTIEEHIHTLIQKKMGLLEGVIGYDDQDQIKRLDRKDLLDLLNQIDQDLS